MTEQEINAESLKRWDATDRTEPYTKIQHQVRKEANAQSQSGGDKEKYGVSFSSDPTIAYGQKQGIERGEALYGQGYKQTSKDTQDVIARRKKMMETPSRASDEIRRSGQQEQRRVRSAGGSDAQQRQVQMNTARMAGMQQDLDYERHLGNQQDMVSSVMRGLSGLEYKYAMLENSNKVIEPPKEEPGFFDFEWL